MRAAIGDLGVFDSNEGQRAEPGRVSDGQMKSEVEDFRDWLLAIRRTPLGSAALWNER